MSAMRAVLPRSGGDPPRPEIGSLPEPAAGPDEVVIAVRATAINHADLLQLRGLYPPPPGESEVPGLECAGTVLSLGPGVTSHAVGDRVMALLAGGGHGERVAVPVGQVMRLPEGLSFVEGAAIPEAALTAWTNLVAEGDLRRGETVLVTGATGGMGTMIVQLARELGARVIVAGRSRERLEPLFELGATAAVSLDETLAEQAHRVTGGTGADLVIDLVGGPHLPRCLGALADRGRLVLVGLLAGRRAELDLGELLRRRLRVTGSVLRARSRAEKTSLVRGFATFAEARLADGRLRAVVDRVLPFHDIGAAYAALAAGGVAGKVAVELEGAG